MTDEQTKYFDTNAKRSVDTNLYIIKFGDEMIHSKTEVGLRGKFARACEEPVTLYCVDMAAMTFKPVITPHTMTAWAALTPGEGLWFRRLAEAKCAVIAEIDALCNKLNADKKAIKKMKEERA
jgi:hypothetical protein